MKLDRRVVGRKRQLLLPIPALMRDHMALVAGARVWWHSSRSGQVVLTTTGQSRGGKPRADADCPSCARYREEVDRLRRELRARESATPGEVFRQGYQQAIRHYGRLSDRLDVALSMLRQVLARAPGEGLPRPPRRVRPRRPVETAPSPDHYPAPPPSPSPPSSEEGADTSGAQLPGVPLEH